MRIGIDCRMYSSRFTGIGRYVYELTENLFRIDQENEYVLFFNQPEFEKFSSPNARVTKVLVNSPHYSVREQTLFLYHVGKTKLDLMHFTHFNAPLLYFGSSVVTIHDLTLSFFHGKKMTSLIHRLGYQLVIRNIIKKAKKIISVSQNTKNDLQKIFHIDSQKIQTTYLGVNEDFHPIPEKELEQQFQPVAEKFHINKPFLLYTGVWRSHKNLPNLIRAFHILKTKHHFDGYLVITGREDPRYKEEILEPTKSLKLEKHILFTGLVDESELILLYNKASVYVFPSLYEGFGLPPLEAMKCKTPVATSSTSCMPEICGEGNALFFDPQSPEDMAEKIARLLNEPALREHCIHNGFARAEQFSWRKMAEETLKIYQEVTRK